MKKLEPNKNISILTGIFLIISINISLGQGIRFDHYAVKDGISQSEILCIFQDSERYIWFGTQNGLNKFDGYSFKKYFFDPSDTTMISNSWIFDITEDDNGFLWIGTKGGLNKFNKKTGVFTRVRIINGNSADNTNFIYGITSDSSNIYVNQQSSLSIINFNTGSIESYTNSFEQERSLYDVGFPIIKDSQGLIWMGSINGLSRFNLKNKQFNNFIHNESDSGTISDNHITALFEDRHGNILIGTGNGLNIFNTKSKKISRYYHDNNRPGSLSHNFIRSITQDHTGAIWIGTNGGGLNKITLSGPAGSEDFIHYRSSPDKINFISHDIVNSLCEDKSNNLWIGTVAGIDKTDLKKKSIKTYLKSDNPNSIDLLDNVIASVYQNSDGKLWIGNWGKPTKSYIRFYSAVERHGKIKK